MEYLPDGRMALVGYHPDVRADGTEMQPGGDLVASFRNTGQILRIATEAHDGVEPGDVVWRLGGQRNEFTFVDDPDGGAAGRSERDHHRRECVYRDPTSQLDLLELRHFDDPERHPELDRDSSQ